MNYTRRLYDKNKTYYCKCGCGRVIELKPYHKSYGVPDYVVGHSRKGKKNSDEHNRKVAIKREAYLATEEGHAKLARIARENGRNPIAREKVRQHKLGSTLSQETKDRISKTKLSSEPTECEIKARKESADRLVKYNKENDPWNKGKPHTPEHIAKISKGNTGKKRTREVRELLSTLAIQRCIDETNFSRGKYFSNKNNCFIKHDSSYEIRAYELLEQEDSIASYKRCNFYIKYFYDGINRSTNPDLLLTFVDGHTEMVEVKPQRWVVNCDKTRKKINVAHQYCKKIGIRYSVWTESKLFADISYNTWKGQKTL